MAEGFTIIVEKEFLKELIQTCAFLGEVQEHCRGRKNIQFFYRNPQGYEYYGVRDMDTSEELKFGQLKEGGFFLRPDAKWSRWGDQQAPVDQERQDGPSHYDQGEPGGDYQEPPQQEAPPPPAATQQPPRRDYQMRQPSQGLPRPPQNTAAPAKRRF